MTPKEAAMEALLDYESLAGFTWEISPHMLASFVASMPREKRQRLTRMLETWLAGYTEENIAAAKAKLEMLRAAS